MTKVQEEKLNMYDTVMNYCNLNTDIIGTMEALEKTVFDFKQILTAIGECLEVQATIISGYATTKNLLHAALIEEATSIASRVYSYAKSIGDRLMMESVDYAVWKLERLRDEELGPVCKKIITAARPFVNQLGPYNITEATLNDFNTHIDAYARYIPLPRAAIVERREHNKILRSLFDSGDDLLKGHMDRQVREFKKTNLLFYRSYTASREIVNNPRTTTQIKGLVTNDKTNKPLAGAIIMILEIERSVRTDHDGYYVIKPVPPGTHTLKIDMEGFESKTIAGVVAKRGKRMNVNVGLVPKEG